MLQTDERTHLVYTQLTENRRQTLVVWSCWDEVTTKCPEIKVEMTQTLEMCQGLSNYSTL